jgi:hypothetical protein
MLSLVSSTPKRRSNAKPLAVQPRSCISVSRSTACRRGQARRRARVGGARGCRSLPAAHCAAAACPFRGAAARRRPPPPATPGHRTCSTTWRDGSSNVTHERRPSSRSRVLSGRTWGGTGGHGPALRRRRSCGRAAARPRGARPARAARAAPPLRPRPPRPSPGPRAPLSGLPPDRFATPGGRAARRRGRGLAVRRVPPPPRAPARHTHPHADLDAAQVGRLAFSRRRHGGRAGPPGAKQLREGRGVLGARRRGFCCITVASTSGIPDQAALTE